MIEHTINIALNRFDETLDSYNKAIQINPGLVKKFI